MTGAVLRIGSKGAEVGNLQRCLNDLLPALAPLVVDEDFGPKTQNALVALQAGILIPPTGVLDVITRQRLIPLGFVPFTQAKNAAILWPKRRFPIQIAIHTAECREGNLNAAEDLAAWAAGKDAPRASWHYAVDTNSITQSVRETDVAWHAGRANDRSIGIEHAGIAQQSAEEWEDAASTAILIRSSRLAFKIAKRWRIPIVRLTIEEIRAGASGFFGHVDANEAFNVRGHTDPGDHFPWESYLAAIRAHG